MRMKNDYVGILNSCSTGRDITGFTHYDIDAKQVIKLLEHYKANNPSALKQLNYAIQAVREKTNRERRFNEENKN